MEKFDKLVRDKIPEIIEAKNKKVKTHIADEMEYWNKLKGKLHEEVQEFIKEENEEELADIMEVFNAICDFKKLDKDYVEKLRLDKFEKRGGFKKRIILDEAEY